MLRNMAAGLHLSQNQNNTTFGVLILILHAVHFVFPIHNFQKNFDFSNLTL